MTEHKERECGRCSVLPMPGCRECHARLLARYQAQRAISDAQETQLRTALAEVREAHAELHEVRELLDLMRDKFPCIEQACRDVLAELARAEKGTP